MTHYIFDCDDVLLDWIGGFKAWLPSQGIYPITDLPVTWEMDRWLNVTKQRVRDLVTLFNQSPDFAKLAEIPGARDTVWRLNDAGHTCSVLTACGDAFQVRQARYHNLSVVFNKTHMGGEERAFTKIIILPLGSSKFDYLFRFTSNYDPRKVVFVEDNFEHAKSGVTNGITSYCIRKRHNRIDEAAFAASSTVRWIDDISEVA